MAKSLRATTSTHFQISKNLYTREEVKENMVALFCDDALLNIYGYL